MKGKHRPADASLETPPPFETEQNVAYFLKKQGISPDEWKSIMAEAPKFFTDYLNYYRYLKLLKYPIKCLGLVNVLPAYAFEK